MILESECLILEPWESADWLSLRAIATDVEVMHYITGGVPWSDEEVQAFVERQRNCYAARGFCRWKLTEKGGGEFAGFCGVGFWRNGLEPEIGWWLARRCWGRGLATEAARVALDDVFERTDLDRIVSIARPANTASTRIMQKLGLRFECEFESEDVELVRYAIHRAEWVSLPSA